MTRDLEGYRGAVRVWSPERDYVTAVDVILTVIAVAAFGAALIGFCEGVIGPHPLLVRLLLLAASSPVLILCTTRLDSLLTTAKIAENTPPNYIISDGRGITFGWGLEHSDTGGPGERQERITVAWNEVAAAVSMDSAIALYSSGGRLIGIPLAGYARHDRRQFSDALRERANLTRHNPISRAWKATVEEIAASAGTKGSRSAIFLGKLLGAIALLVSYPRVRVREGYCLTPMGLRGEAPAEAPGSHRSEDP